MGLIRRCTLTRPEALLRTALMCLLAFFGCLAIAWTVPPTTDFARGVLTGMKGSFATVGFLLFGAGMGLRLRGQA